MACEKIYGAYTGLYNEVNRQFGSKKSVALR